MALLEVSALTKEFGGLVAVNSIDFGIEDGEIRGLIGPNGAGKTTFFNLVTGVLQPTSGSILFDGASLARKKPHQITRRGIARTFQNIRLFNAMTAVENVMVGLDAHHKTSVAGAIIGSPLHRAEERHGSREGLALLERVGIRHLANQLARNLSYGDQRRVEIARALGTGPRLLLLDEPAAGMNPVEKVGLMSLIRSINDSGITILLIEHDMKVVMGICRKVSVLDFGQKIAEGLPEALQKDPRVIEAYLGRGAAEAGSA